MRRQLEVCASLLSLLYVAHRFSTHDGRRPLHSDSFHELLQTLLELVLLHVVCVACMKVQSSCYVARAMTQHKVHKHNCRFPQKDHDKAACCMC